MVRSGHTHAGLTAVRGPVVLVTVFESTGGGWSISPAGHMVRCSQTRSQFHALSSGKRAFSPSPSPNSSPKPFVGESSTTSRTVRPCSLTCGEPDGPDHARASDLAR
jgi:hypothetical protein